VAWSDEGRTGESDADVLIRRATRAQADGRLEEAESLFGDAEALLTRALEQSDSAGAPEDDLPILLRDLSRVCILQSAYKRAERPLVRLLSITEAQGEGRPEVATVVASLAAVRQALGDYTSAEQLYRQALNIRERTLTPNHITTAATMESLAETCAARGSFAEAVSLRNRALSIREMTLGSADATVRVARKRISDMQLEAQEERRVSTPPGSLRALDTLPHIEPPQMEHRPIVGASRLPAVLVPWADELASVRDEIESTSPAVRDDRAPRRSSLATALETRSSTTTIACRNRGRAGCTGVQVATQRQVAAEHLRRSGAIQSGGERRNAGAGRRGDPAGGVADTVGHLRDRRSA